MNSRLFIRRQRSQSVGDGESADGDRFHQEKSANRPCRVFGIGVSSSSHVVTALLASSRKERFRGAFWMEYRSEMVASGIGFHRRSDSRRSQDAFGRDRSDRGDRIRLCRRDSIGARSIGTRHACSTRPSPVRLFEADGRAVPDLRDDDGDLSARSR